MKEKIFSLIEDVLKLPAGTVTEESTVENTEGWESLTHVLIIGELEAQLGISIPLDEAIEITNVKELLEKAGV